MSIGSIGIEASIPIVSKTLPIPDPVWETYTLKRNDRLFRLYFMVEITEVLQVIPQLVVNRCVPIRSHGLSLRR